MAALTLSLVILLAAPPTSPAAGPTLEQVLASQPADSLVAALRRFEREHGRERAGGEAALMLGRLYYARGEYRQAAETLARAAARLDPDRKDEARYWAGLSWLALKDPSQTRAWLDEVSTASARHAEALLGIAFAWELAERPERAFETLQRLLQRDPGEAGPAALEHLAALATRLQLSDQAARARARLLREYPNSIEAASAAQAPPALPSATRAIAVEIGAFSSAARARSLLRAARQAGYAGAQVEERGAGPTHSFHVRLGAYPNAEEARRQGEEAARKLGVAFRLVEAP